MEVKLFEKQKLPGKPACRLHVFGASGSGVTTLGRAIASDWFVPSHDVDDYYWLPTDPPFEQKRPISDRLALMEAMFLNRKAWVLSGSLISWSDSLVPHFDAVVFVSLNNTTRLQRLLDREFQRYGADEVQPGGRYHEKLQAFLEWANQYEDPDFKGRSRVSHEAWLQTLTCPIIRVDSAQPVEHLVKDINTTLTGLESPRST